MADKKFFTLNTTRKTITLDTKVKPTELDKEAVQMQAILSDTSLKAEPPPQERERKRQDLEQRKRKLQRQQSNTSSRRICGGFCLPLSSNYSIVITMSIGHTQKQQPKINKKYVNKVQKSY